jgi:hypothetical protein
MGKPKWISLHGFFNANDGALVFHGKSNAPLEQLRATLGDANLPESFPEIGIALSDQLVSDGSVSADVTFSEIDTESLCTLVVSFDPNTRLEIGAGIGGAKESMFVIRSWPWNTGPDSRAQAFIMGGSRATLRAERSYHLEAVILASQVRLKIDGIEVARVFLPEPLPARRAVGVSCASRAKVTIDNFVVSSQKPRAFVVMEFSPSFDDLYSQVIKSICTEYEVESLRADEIAGPGFIVGDIVQQIAEAQLVIADVTPRNPNVFFEVGYALALQKPIILLAKKGTTLPFDVAPFRVLFYEDTIGGKTKIEEGLRKHVKGILQR